MYPSTHLLLKKKKLFILLVVKLNFIIVFLLLNLKIATTKTKKNFREYVKEGNRIIEKKTEFIDYWKFS